MGECLQVGVLFGFLQKGKGSGFCEPARSGLSVRSFAARYVGFDRWRSLGDAEHWLADDVDLCIDGRVCSGMVS